MCYDSFNLSWLSVSPGHPIFFFSFSSTQKPLTVSACISAHMSKIHDLDWSYKNERLLTTCSHDATVKVWDVQSYRESLSTIKARNNPVWRARNYVSLSTSTVFIAIATFCTTWRSMCCFLLAAGRPGDRHGTSSCSARW